MTFKIGRMVFGVLLHPHVRSRQGRLGVGHVIASTTSLKTTLKTSLLNDVNVLPKRL